MIFLVRKGATGSTILKLKDTHQWPEFKYVKMASNVWLQTVQSAAFQGLYV